MKDKEKFTLKPQSLLNLKSVVGDVDNFNLRDFSDKTLGMF